MMDGMMDYLKKRRPSVSSLSHYIRMESNDGPGNPEMEDLNQVLRLDFNLKALKLSETISKVQHRGKNTIKQMMLRPSESEIKLELDFVLSLADWQNINIIRTIKLKVKRAVSIPGYYSDFVLLDPSSTKFEIPEPTKVIVTGDLSRVWEQDIHHDVYKLARNDKERNNKFFVQVVVEFNDGSVRRSDDNANPATTFMVLGAKPSASSALELSDPAGNMLKRRRINDNDYVAGSPASSFSSGTSPSSPASFNLGSPYNDPHTSVAFMNAQKAVIDDLQSRSGIFDNLYSKIIKSGNGDIAYHFELKDQEDPEDLMEGEIIGFTTNDKGKVKVVKLNSTNSHNVFLKGVVAKSPYLEANLPKDENVLTATICMLGMVPVLTMGPVDAGDCLYPSRDVGFSGIATPEYYVADRNNASSVGFALETINNCYDDEVNSVNALVSMMGGAIQEEIRRSMKIMEKNIDEKIEVNKQKAKKRAYTIGGMLLLFTLLAVYICYERYSPGTWYQKLRCQYIGDRPTATATYFYYEKGREYLGSRFTDCGRMWEATVEDRRYFSQGAQCDGDHKNKCLPGYDYYINQMCCTGFNPIGSSYMFAVDKECTKLQSFDEVLGDWCVDMRVCARRGNLRCSHMPQTETRQCNLSATCYDGQLHNESCAFKRYLKFL